MKPLFRELLIFTAATLVIGAFAATLNFYHRGKIKEKIPFCEVTPKEIKTAGYWVSKTDFPDKIQLDENQITELNLKIKMCDTNITDIADYPDTIDISSFTNTLSSRMNWIRQKKYITAELEPVEELFFKESENAYSVFSGTSAINIRFAITVKYSDVRILPSDMPIFTNEDTLDIDRLREESLDTGTPVAVISETKDKNWIYVVSNTLQGWTKTENIAFASRKNIEEWINDKNFVITTGIKTDIFADSDMKKYLGYLRMGTKLPLIKQTAGITCVKIPSRKADSNIIFTNGYIKTEGLNIGFLKYTQRNILMQAFKFLNAPYGWGSYNGEQDCSSFISRVFLCFGIVLPESSFQKSKFLPAELSNDGKEKQIADNAKPGLSLLYLPGHIMLYIGQKGTKPYAIHAIWGISSYNAKNQKTVKYINKVIVSDLDLGKEVAGNSLLERTSKIITVL